MRGTYEYVLNWLRLNWQPALVVVGVALTIIGAVGTVYLLTSWLAPALGIAPAVTVGGVLLTATALLWARVTVLETDR